jgi:hypothetical protein
MMALVQGHQAGFLGPWRLALTPGAPHATKGSHAHEASAVRFVITSGTGLREIIEERSDARSAREHVMRLISLKRPGIRVFDPDGQRVSLEKLSNLAKQEGEKAS